MEMKTKAIVQLYILILCIGTIMSLSIPKSEAMVAEQEQMIIPNEAIRLRILANSDLEADQQIKRHIRDAVNAEITEWVKDLESIEAARSLIQSNLPEIEQIAKKVIEQENLAQDVNVSFGRVAFPTKLYGQFLYPAGEYEAILITLGEGKGANWWCVLFPPLCFLDFSNGVAVSDGFDETKDQEEEKTAVYVEEDEEEVKVKFFIIELWEKLFG